MSRNEKPASNLNMWITAILAIAVLLFVVFLIFNKQRIVKPPQNQSPSTVFVNEGAAVLHDSCPPPALSLADFQEEIRQNLIEHNLSMMAGGQPEDDFTRSARGLVDVAIRCRKFSLQDIKITHDDLRALGMEKPQARKGEAPASPSFVSKD